MSADTLVFIPAWNEESSLPGVLAETRRDLPGVNVLVIDDGSEDATATVAREGGARVVVFPENRGLRSGIAEGYRQAADGGYEFCGRLDADGQHPAAELARIRPRAIHLHSELLTEGMRDAIRQAFACDCFDDYSTFEFHHVAYECRRHRYHLAYAFARSTTTGRAVGVEGFHFVTDAHGVSARLATSSDAQAHLPGLNVAARPVQ